MKNLLILQPTPIVTVTASRGSGAANLLTPDPREVWRDAFAGTATLDLDFGMPRVIDTLFLGHLFPPHANATWSITGGITTATSVAIAAASALRVPDVAGRSPVLSHALWYGQPVSVRYVRLSINQPGGSAPLSAGVVMAGRALAPTWNHEWGSGRRPIDTGSTTALPDGGFAVVEGVRKSAWSWTMGDLTDDELDALWEIALDRGESRPLLVVEDPDRTAGLRRRLHYGIFRQFQEYERSTRNRTRWELKIEDWGADEAAPISSVTLDVTPDPFAFPAVVNAALNSTVQSAAIYVSGIEAAAEIAIVGGEYQINGGNWATVPGLVSNGASVRVRLVSSLNHLTTSIATLTIGGISAEFSVQTMVEAPAAPTIDQVVAGDKEVTITWIDGTDNGAPITHHRIYANGTLIAQYDGGSPFVATGLSNGTEYVFEVSAVNKAGESPKSPSRAAIPVPRPSLTLTPASKSIPANAPSGYQLFVINGVPRGVTPTISPNDGRFVIGGSEGFGWYGLVGLGALSAGTFNIAVIAPGTTGASFPLTITSAVAPPASSLIHGFDTLGSATAQAGSRIILDTVNKIGGAAALRAEGKSTNQAAMGASTIFNANYDMTGYTRVAMWVNCGNYLHNPIGAVRLAASPYGYTRDSVNASYNNPFGYSSRGWRWVSFYWPNMRDGSGNPITAAGPGNKFFALSVIALAASNGAATVTADQVIRVSDTHKPMLALTLDDANVDQFEARDMFAAYGVKPTIYLPHLMLGQSGRLTLPQLQLLHHTYGWGVCMDSEGNDLPLSAQPTVEQALAEMAKVAAYIDQYGFDPRGKRHFCYSYGGRGLAGQPFAPTGGCASDGAAQSTLTMTVNNPFQYLSVGQRLRGTNVPPNTYIIQIDRAWVKVNNQIPAGSGIPITFLGREFGLTVTADGSKVITVSSAINLHVGMHMFADGVQGRFSSTPQPDDTRITGISGNTVTLSNPVPATVTLADFGYADSPWWETTVQDKLLQAGLLTGRLGIGISSSSNGQLTAFGADPRTMIAMNAVVAENQSAGSGSTPVSITNAFIAQGIMNIKEGADTVGYGHRCSTADVQPGGHWPTILAWAQGRSNAGELDVVTIPDMSDAIFGRPFYSG